MELAAHAKSAADVDSADPHCVRLESERSGERITVVVRHLCRPPDQERSGRRIESCEQATPLEWDRSVSVQAEPFRDDDLRDTEGLVDIARSKVHCVDEVSEALKQLRRVVGKR